MSKKEDKMKLEQEVNALADKVYNYTGYRLNDEELKQQYIEEKHNYKKQMHEVFKVKGIRNLKVLGNVSMLLLPFVICGGVFTGSMFGLNHVMKEQPVDVGDETKIISMDNSGTYEEELGAKGCSDKIVINTKWFREDDTLVRYTYELEEEIDLHTKEEVEEVVNKDYFTLLNQYKFEETNKEVAEFTEERAKSDLGEDLITVKAGVEVAEEEVQKINSSLKNSYVWPGVCAGILTLIPITFFKIFDYEFGDYFDGIDDAVYDANRDLKDLPKKKEEKKKLKELKRKIK